MNTNVNPSFAGKVALIAGASRGIGAVTARAFADAGAAVVLAARDAKAMDSVAKEIQSVGGRVLAVPTDVGDVSSVEQLVQKTISAFGRLDAAFTTQRTALYRLRSLISIRQTSIEVCARTFAALFWA
jgi:NAD(P)-dependent dehydrogenase (short-subunit alcohol dehydrogenase family)